MTTSDNNTNKHESAEQVDDLTRFLDEDFDTDEVDLFEFTTEEDSPLTKLKSIVLSLDWEITDDTLVDLAEEISHLKEQELFQADKVSQVYLQGIDKIGQYVQSEGAYAHRNAIKLLLTLFYDFEKILSSETITGAEITALLKADVRKFKILQYQIAQKHGAEAEFTEETSSTGLVLTDSEALQGIQAAILELDWEVTDEGLSHLSDQLENLKSTFADNKYIQVLVQGLFSLNTYINEERAKTHPEAFSLLHTFCSGLESLIENDDLGDEERQEIVVDNVNRLNNLKNLIAGLATEEVEVLDEDAVEAVTDEGEDGFFDEDLDIEPETVADIPVTDDEIGFDDEIIGKTDTGEDLDIGLDEAVAEAPGEAIDFDEDEGLEPLAAEDTEEELDIAPALAESPDEEGLDLDEAPPEELEEKLQFFFGKDEETPEPEPISEKEPVAQIDEAPALLDEEESFDDLDIAPALAESPDEEGLDLDEAPPEELEEKLQFFFGSDEESPALEEGEEAVAAETAELEPAPELEPVSDLEDVEEDLDIIPALAGSPEESGFGTTEDEAAEAPPEELEENLEFFFGKDEATPEAEAADEAVIEEAPPAEPEALFEGEEEEPEMAPALAESPDEEGLDLDEAPPEELTENLEALFGADETMPEAEAAEEAVIEEAPPAEPEALFEGEEEEPEMAPALAESPDEEGLDLDEAPPEELTENLDAFFGADETTPEVEAAEEAVIEEAEAVPEALFEGEEEEPEMAPALAESPSEEGLDLDEAPPEELAENLDAFFGADETTPEAETAEEAVIEEAPPAEPEALFEGEEEEPEMAPALAESPDEEGLDLDEAPSEELAEKLDFFFGEDEVAAEPAVEETITEEAIEEVSDETEEEVLLTPSLEETVEDTVPVPGVITSAEEYQVAVEQIRTEYAEKENTLRQEIESLHEEIRSLRAELQSK